MEDVIVEDGDRDKRAYVFDDQPWLALRKKRGCCGCWARTAIGCGTVEITKVGVMERPEVRPLVWAVGKVGR